MFSILFGFQGRIARLPYFGYALLAVLIWGILGGAGGVILAEQRDNGSVIVGAILLIAALGGLIWTGIALAVKRLHDMNMSGLHVLWIWGVNILASALANAAPALAIICTVASFLIGLWLLFSPGTVGPNRYDVQPSGGAVPATA